MRVIDCEQRTPEWYAARAGVITASTVSTCRLKPSTAGYRRMVYRLAVEIMQGAPVEEDHFVSAAMQRGIDLEPEAREAYAFATDVDVTEVGFCLHDDERYGCSPDRLVSPVGLVEIKCPDLHTHCEYLLDDIVPAAYRDQMEWQLYVTGREWCDFVSYCPIFTGRPLFVRRYTSEPARRADLKDVAARMMRDAEQKASTLRTIGGLAA